MNEDIFSSLMVNTEEGTTTGVPLRPQGIEVLNLRHNGQTGALTIQFPTLQSGDRGEVLDAKSYSLIPLFITKIATSSNGISSNPSLSGVGYYDLYRYEDTMKGRVSNSLGIFTSKGLKDHFAEEGAKVKHRIFGLLIKKDSGSINKDESLKDLSTRNDGLVVAYIDLLPSKYFALAQQLNCDYSKVANLIAGKVLTVEGVTKTNLDVYYNKTSKGGVFLPKFSLDNLQATSKQRLASKSKDLIINVLSPYINEIKENDVFLNSLVSHNFIQPKTVERLGNIGIVNDKTLKSFLGEPEDWNKIVSVVNDQPTLQAGTTTTVDPTPKVESKVDDYSKFLDSTASDDFSNDDLPF